MDDAVPRRPRRRFEEIERAYTCSYPHCAKSYGTLSHLNDHVRLQAHGARREPGEFRDLRRRRRQALKFDDGHQEYSDSLSSRSSPSPAPSPFPPSGPLIPIPFSSITSEMPPPPGIPQLASPRCRERHPGAKWDMRPLTAPDGPPHVSSSLIKPLLPPCSSLLTAVDTMEQQNRLPPLVSSVPLKSFESAPPSEHPRQGQVRPRPFACNFAGCSKTYATLKHLNEHVTVQRHGPKRTRSEFALALEVVMYTSERLAMVKIDPEAAGNEETTEPVAKFDMEEDEKKSPDFRYSVETRFVEQGHRMNGHRDTSDVEMTMADELVSYRPSTATGPASRTAQRPVSRAKHRPSSWTQHRPTSWIPWKQEPVSRPPSSQMSRSTSAYMSPPMPPSSSSSSLSLLLNPPGPHDHRPPVLPPVSSLDLYRERPTTPVSSQSSVHNHTNIHAPAPVHSRSSARQNLLRSPPPSLSHGDPNHRPPHRPSPEQFRPHSRNHIQGPHYTVPSPPHRRPRSAISNPHSAPPPAHMLGCFDSHQTPRHMSSPNEHKAERSSKTEDGGGPPGSATGTPTTQYICTWPGCGKSYGRLGNLNAHIFLQRHGERRHAQDFKSEEAQQHSGSSRDSNPPESTASLESPVLGRSPVLLPELKKGRLPGQGRLRLGKEPLDTSQGRQLSGKSPSQNGTGQPSAARKRFRRSYSEIERLYACVWPGCTKSYGTLNHLNNHISLQEHGMKREASEFKELRKMWRQEKMERRRAERNAAWASKLKESVVTLPVSSSSSQLLQGQSTSANSRLSPSTWTRTSSADSDDIAPNSDDEEDMLAASPLPRPVTPRPYSSSFSRDDNDSALRSTI